MHIIGIVDIMDIIAILGIIEGADETHTQRRGEGECDNHTHSGEMSARAKSTHTQRRGEGVG